MELPGSLQLSTELIDIADIDIAQIDIDNFDIAEGIDLDSLSHHIDMTLTPAKAAEVDEFFAQWDDHDNLEEVLTLFKNSGTTIRKFFTRTKAVLNNIVDQDEQCAPAAICEMFGQTPLRCWRRHVE